MEGCCIRTGCAMDIGGGGMTCAMGMSCWVGMAWAMGRGGRVDVGCAVGRGGGLGRGCGACMGEAIGSGGYNVAGVQCSS